MYCTNCGERVPDYETKCPYCYHKLGKSESSGNIFTDLMTNRTNGSILEFILWCSNCFFLILSLMAVILVDGHISVRMLWLFMMLVQIGLSVLMVFKLRNVVLLYSTIGFHLILFIFYSVVMVSFTGSSFIFALIFFILLLFFNIAIVVLTILQIFGKRDFGKLLRIFSISSTGAFLLFAIILYVLAATNKISSYYFYYDYFSMSGTCFWLGSIVYFLVLSCITLYYWRVLYPPFNEKKGSFGGGGGKMPPERAMLMCVNGYYQGQSIPIHNSMIISIGSQNQASLIIPDPSVDGLHCYINFNARDGLYEVFDASSHGVYANGRRIRSNVYVQCERGTQIAIGSNRQLFILQ